MKALLLSTIACLATSVYSQTFNGGGGPILDNQSISIPISVSGLPSSINTSTFGLEQVCINLTHTYDADLTISVIAPDGTSINLAEGNGGGGHDFTNTCFRSDATTSIAAGTAPFTGTYKPMGQMGLINNNQNPNGTWQIRVTDGYSNDQGNLSSCSITFGNDPAIPTVFNSSNLPIVIITTQQAIPDEPKIQGSMKIIDNGSGNLNYVNDFPNAYNNKIGIERRGSSSGGFPQKSYGLETRNVNGTPIDTILLNMPAESDWILYAPYNDKTCMRNILTYDLTNEMGHYAARTKLCELVLNNQYQGIYVLMEKIKRDGDRVDISKLLPTDISGDELTGGYIVKIDKTTGSTNDGWFSSQPSTTGSAIYYQFHYPSQNNIVPQQENYIKAYIDSFEVAANGPNAHDPLIGYRKYTMPETFIDYFLMNEISKNVDGYRLSAFMHKEKNSKGGKLRMGPVWDYNLGWWNANYCAGDDPTGWALAFGTVCGGDGYQIPAWWVSMFNDPWLQDELKCRYTQLRQTLFNETYLFGKIDSIAALLNQAEVRHFEQWPIMGAYTWPNPSPLPTSYAEEITALKTWITNRLAWLDDNIPGTCHLGLDGNALADLNIQVFPNPAEDVITVSWNTKQDPNLRISWMQLDGKLVHTTSVSSMYGNNSKTFDVHELGLSSGVYQLILENSNGRQSLKVIVQ